MKRDWRPSRFTWSRLSVKYLLTIYREKSTISQSNSHQYLSRARYRGKTKKERETFLRLCRADGPYFLLVSPPNFRRVLVFSCALFFASSRGKWHEQKWYTGEKDCFYRRGLINFTTCCALTFVLLPSSIRTVKQIVHDQKIQLTLHFIL